MDPIRCWGLRKCNRNEPHKLLKNFKDLVIDFLGLALTVVAPHASGLLRFWNVRGDQEEGLEKMGKIHLF